MDWPTRENRDRWRAIGREWRETHPDEYRREMDRVGRNTLIVAFLILLAAVIWLH